MKVRKRKNAMRNVILLLSCTVSFAAAQIKREKAPDLERYLTVPTDIKTQADIPVPKLTGTLKGVHENLPSVRTPRSVFNEIQQNQSRLNYLYKTWRFKAADGLGSGKFGLMLTIAPSGDVTKVVVKGPENKAFIKEVEANIRTWGFSKVSEKHPFVANIRNLDFAFRKTIALE